MTAWDRESLSSRIDRFIMQSYPARWLRSRSLAAPPVFTAYKRLWPSALILTVATILAALAWLRPPEIPPRVSIPALAGCVTIATFTRSLCKGRVVGLRRRMSPDEREQAVRREAYSKTYLALTLLSAFGMLALMSEALLGTTARLTIGQNAVIILMFGSIVLSAFPVLLEATRYHLSEDSI